MMKENDNADATFQGYEERTISIGLANVLSIILLVLCFGATIVIYHLVWGKIDHPDHNNLWIYVIGALCLAVGMIAHELIHGFFWGIAAPHRFRDISFGVMWKQLAPYCHCKEPLRRDAYLLGALAPLLILGIIPWIVGIARFFIDSTIWGAVHHRSNR